MNKKSKKISIITKSLLGVGTVVSAIAIPMAFVNGSTVSTYNFSTELQANEMRPDSHIKIKSLNDANLNDEQKAKIRQLYKQTPSSVTASESKSNTTGTTEIALSPTSIFNILEFSDDVYGLDSESISQGNAPIVTNLTNISIGKGFTWDSANGDGWPGENTPPNDGLSNADSDIPYLVRETTDPEQKTTITQKELDNLGFLFLRVDMREQNTLDTITEFIMLSGFNSNITRKYLSSNIDLPGSEYKKNVNQISNSDLLSYPTFENVQPSSAVVSSRTNNSKDGTLNYTVTYTYDLDKSIKISRDNYTGDLLVKNVTQDEIDNINYSSLSYDQEFLLSGFTRSPNISTTQIVEILAIIIAVGVAIAFCIYIGSLVTRKIRFAKKL